MDEVFFKIKGETLETMRDICSNMIGEETLVNVDNQSKY